MKVIITGAAGFIGSHVLQKMKHMDMKVLGVDNFSPYYSVEYKNRRLENLGIKLNEDLKTCDISDINDVNSIFSIFKPDYVIHLAAQAGVRLDLAEYDSYILSNISGFNNIVNAASKHKVKGILYASSSSVYGDVSAIPYKENSINLKPKSFYAVTKLGNELFAEIQSKVGGQSFRGLRFFTVYGPWGRPDMAYFRLAAAAIGQGKFTLFGDGSVKRDFTYIDDVVMNTVALFQDLTTKDPGFNDIVNIGGNKSFEMNHLINLVSRNANQSMEILKTETSVFDAKTTAADTAYLQSILGQVGFTSLEQGVEYLMNWVKGDDVFPHLQNWIESTN
jgi:UDP-glucuronate 4-epimerase